MNNVEGKYKSVVVLPRPRFAVCRPRILVYKLASFLLFVNLAFAGLLAFWFAFGETGCGEQASHFSLQASTFFANCQLLFLGANTCL